MLCVVLAAGSVLPSGYSLLSDRKLDGPAGRYTQVRISNSTPTTTTIVWNGNVPRAGIRLVTCPTPRCVTWSPPVTLAADPNPRFIRMELEHGQLPVMAFGAANTTVEMAADGKRQVRLLLPSLRVLSASALVSGKDVPASAYAEDSEDAFALLVSSVLANPNPSR